MQKNKQPKKTTKNKQSIYEPNFTKSEFRTKGPFSEFFQNYLKENCQGKMLSLQEGGQKRKMAIKI